MNPIKRKYIIFTSVFVNLSYCNVVDETRNMRTVYAKLRNFVTSVIITPLPYLTKDELTTYLHRKES